MRHRGSWSRRVLAAALLTAVVAGCGSDDDAVSDDDVGTAATTVVGTATPASGDEPGPDAGPLRVGAIPDQDPEQLARTYDKVSAYLAEALGVEVEYVPVSDYAASVSLFRTGDLDLVWFGGLTGVQARLQTPGSELIAQRDIDQMFHSVFIANADAEIAPIDAVEDLTVFAGTRFTFGSESSTSGRLMPQYFLDQAGIGPDDFDGEAGFSGSHDATIDLVEAGTYQGGALNEQVWRSRLADGSVDTSRVVEVFSTPAYHDYQWVAGPTVAERFGEDFSAEIEAAITSLSSADPAQAEILELFGAESFVPADPADYAEIEEIGRTLGLITE